MAGAAALGPRPAVRGPIRHALPPRLHLHTSACGPRQATARRARLHARVVCQDAPHVSSSLRFTSDASPAAAARELERRQLRWASAAVEGPDLEGALAEAAQQAVGRWPAGGHCTPQLALVFVSATHAAEFDLVLPALRRQLPSLQHVVGCSGAGVLGPHKEGGTEEWEARPAVSLTLATLPGVALRSFHIAPSMLPDSDAPPRDWHRLTRLQPCAEGHTNFVLLGDAGFGGMEALLEGLDFAYPGARVAGAVSSAMAAGMRGALWQWSAEECEVDSSRQGGVRAGGCVGVALQGPIAMEPIVARGALPLAGGMLFRVTRAAPGGVILELQAEGGGERLAPLQALQGLLGDMNAAERDRAMRKLLVGLVADGFKPSAALRSGDLLARRVLGAHAGSGAIKIAGQVHERQRLALMVWSREEAMADIADKALLLKRRALEAGLSGAQPRPPPLGALVFTSEGRGQGLFLQRGYDSQTLERYVSAPCAGLFGSAEVGQEGGAGSATHLHALSCSAAIFRPAQHAQQDTWAPLQRAWEEQPWQESDCEQP